MTLRGVFLTAVAVLAVTLIPAGTVYAAEDHPGSSLTADPYGATYVPGGPRGNKNPVEVDPALAVKPDAKMLTPSDPGYNAQQKQKLPTEAPWLAIEKKLEARHTANPMDTLYVGPVAQGDDVADMSMPHRSQKEVADWIVLALSEVLSMDYSTYVDHLKQLQIGMDDNAVGQLEGFMQSSNVLDTMKNQNLVLRCYIEEQPLLLNKGPVDGRYRWLFDVPVVLSFLPPGAKSYEKTQASVSIQHVIIRIQIGRVPKLQGIDQLKMETFEVRQNQHPNEAPKDQ
jgi:hypothetical protein